MAISNNSIVAVFPSVQYAQTLSTSNNVNLNSRALGEVGIVNLIKRICSNDSFVLDFDGTNIEFILHGYYFKIKTTDIFTSNTVTYYAHIQMDNNVADDDFPEIKGTVVNGSFQGITINNAPYDGFKLYENGKVPDESKLRFKSDNIDFTGDYIIDCGFIT